MQPLHLALKKRPSNDSFFIFLYDLTIPVLRIRSYGIRLTWGLLSNVIFSVSHYHQQLFISYVIFYIDLFFLIIYPLYTSTDRTYQLITEVFLQFYIQLYDS